MAEHTPGPWEYRAEWSEVFKYFNQSRSALIADCASSSLTIAECQANARLIAAAPDMYAALKAMLDPDAEGDIQQAIAAIAKAEGPGERDAAPRAG